VNSLHGKDKQKTSNLKKDHGGLMIKKVIVTAAAGTFILSGILAGATTKQTGLDPMATPTPSATPKEKKKKDKKETPPAESPNAPAPSESPKSEPQPSPAESPKDEPKTSPSPAR
jgi:outer membrane biosynthesis protein TonB